MAGHQDHVFESLDLLVLRSPEAVVRDDEEGGAGGGQWGEQTKF